MNKRARLDVLLKAMALAPGIFLGLLGLGTLAGTLPRDVMSGIITVFLKMRICETDCGLPAFGLTGRLTTGFLLTGLAVVLTAYLHGYRRVHRFIHDHYFGILNVLTAAMVLWLVLLSVNRFFSWDEFEHVHCAWLIHDGLLPYVDFFENHHPLLWVVLIPFMTVIGESYALMIVLRLLWRPSRC